MYSSPVFARLASSTVTALVVVASVFGGCRTEVGSQPVPAPNTPEAVVAPEQPEAEVVSGMVADVATPSKSADVPAVQAVPDDVVARLLADFAQDAWYGVYFGGRKVGHVHAFRKRDDDPDRANAPWLVAFELSMRFEAGLGGPSNELRGGEMRWYELKSPYRLISTDYVQKGMQFNEERSARRDGADFMVSRRLADGAVEEKRLPASAETLGAQFLMAVPDNAVLAEGARTTVAMWNWEGQKDELVSVAHIANRVLMRAGVEQTITELDITWPSIGVPARTIVGAGGLVLESTLGPALVMKLEERDVAISGIEGLDVVSTAVPSPVALGNPGRVDRLDYRVKLKVDLSIPSDAAQRVIAGDDGSFVIERRREGDREPARSGEAERWLQSDPMMDSDHPGIIAAAKKILGDTAPAGEEAVSRIARWVFSALDKRLATHLPAASVILEKKFGDCTEHTWLAVALLRVSGMPARVVYGIAYTGDLERVFAYHAWVEVIIDGHWVAVDPTWGQDAADATHLKFGHEAGGVAPFLDALEIISVSVPPAP